jgi:predicted NBD/HSP70 family sugar kinase
VLGIGLSLPGTVDPVRGVSVGSPVMAGWDGVELAPYLADVAPAPLFVANDADVLARSELLGRPGAFSDVLVVKASTGLGMGIIADGRVLSGHVGAAGEIGHTLVDAADGLRCRCGATGCLETLAGGWALVTRLAEAGHEVGHVRDLVALARRGDPVARGLLRDSGRHLGELLAVAVNLLNPQAVVIGGDMGNAFDVYAAGVRESVYARAAALTTRDLQILPAAHGDRAGLVGCAALALDHVLAPAAVDARLMARERAGVGALR